MNPQAGWACFEGLHVSALLMPLVWPSQEVKKEIDAAVDKAKNSPIPKDEALWKNIYKDTLGGKMKGLDSSSNIQL